MATKTVTITDNGSSVTFGFSNTGGAGELSSNPIELQEGDVLEFSTVMFPGDPAQTISSFSSIYWTSTSNILFTSTGTNSRTVKTNPTLGASSVSVSASGRSGDTCYFEIVSSVDGLPDSIDGDLGSDITNANPSQVYEFNPVTVSGVNTAIVSRVTGNGAQQRKSLNGSWQTADMIVNNGDTIYVRGTSSSSYSTGETFTLKIGSNVGSTGVLNTTYVQDSITVTTGVDPNSGTKIPFPISSGTISLSDIIEFWGGRDYVGASYVAPKDIGSYYRGGSYVPNLTSVSYTHLRAHET